MPIFNDLHINKALTNISVAYIQNTSVFIADRVFPRIPVDFQSDKYFIYEPTQYLIDDVQKVAPGGEAPLIDFTVKSRDAYSCDVMKLADKIPVENLSNQDTPLDIEMDSARLLAQKMLLHKEIRFAKTFLVPGVWGTDLKGSDKGDFVNTLTKWDKPNSTPIEDIEILKEKMQIETAQRFNTAVITRPIYRAWKNHPEILSRILYKAGDNPAIITQQLMASVFDLDNIFVMDAIYNPGKEGKPGENEFIGGKSALLCYVPPSPGLRTPASGYTFCWTKLMEKMNGGRSVSKVGVGDFGLKQYWDERTSSYFNEAWMSYDQRIIGKNLGIFLQDIVS